jgi:hypothetical protein
VLDASDANLGSINDIIFTKDGKMNAVVIGVGGFLGIGQKNVAVSIDAIDRTTDADGNLKLVLNVSADQLDAAAAFKSLADIKREQELEKLEQQPLTPAPAPSTTM